MDYARLKTELADDPEQRGYAAMSDAAAAVDLRIVYRQVNVEAVSGQQIFEAVTLTDFGNLSDAQKGLLYAIIGMGSILVNGTNTRAALVAMFSATVTLTNLVALQTRAVSRAEELGLGRVRPIHVKKARAA